MSEIPTQEVPNPLPVGLRVLAIDNDLTVLENVKRMSNGCHYQVITYSNALLALDHVRKSKGCIDLILIDVHMPNMDGYEFLKEIRKEIDVPVIVMSVDDSTSTRMEAIKHGACDYWKKPFHEDQFRNMWMHVANARKACNKNKLEIQSGRLEDDNEKKRGNNDSEATTGVVSEPNARPKKKARVIWTDELHNKFLNAFRQLEEIGTAVPKRILELMNVPDLTREKVASHLQKFRHQVQKNKSNEVTRQQKNGEPLPKTVQATRKPGRLECQAFAATGRVACETLTTTCLRPEMPKEEQWPNHPGHGVNQDVTSYGHPPPIIGNAQIRIPQPMIMNVDEVSGYGVWSPSANTMRQLSIQENHVLTMDTLHLQQQQQQQQQRQESLIMHPPSVNLQPSCMLQVSQDSPIFHGYTTPAPAPAPAPAPVFHAANTFVPYASTSSDSLYQQPLLNFGYDDNQMYIPRASRGHEIKQSASDEDHRAYIRPPKQVTTTLMKQPRNLHL